MLVVHVHYSIYKFVLFYCFSFFSFLFIPLILSHPLIFHLKFIENTNNYALQFTYLFLVPTNVLTVTIHLMIRKPQH